jgi:AraC-like DNA-binding protein
MINGRRALAIVASALILSALSDIAIALDIGATNGRRLGQILLVLQAVSIVSMCLLLWGAIPTATVRDLSVTDPDELSKEEPGLVEGVVSEQQADDFATLAAGVRELQLFLDPGLNLQRLARKLGIPARRVSQAVNTSQGVNVSVWINNLRVEEAQRLLADPDRTIAEVIYACGFSTKSSFNREFKRVAGAPPSVWRRSLVQSE